MAILCLKINLRGLFFTLKTEFKAAFSRENKPIAAQDPVWRRRDDRLAGVTRRHI